MTEKYYLWTIYLVLDIRPGVEPLCLGVDGGFGGFYEYMVLTYVALTSTEPRALRNSTNRMGLGR